MTTTLLASETVVDAPVVERRPTPCMDTGKIISPRSQQEIKDTIRRWRRHGVQHVAHDLECAASNTVPNGTGLHPHLGNIRLAQFGVRDGGRGYPEALVIDCWKHDPAPAYKLLADERWPVIIHFAQMEQRWHGWCGGLAITNLIDTHHVSKLIHGTIAVDEFTGEEIRVKHSLGVVTERELGLPLDKTQQNSAWDAAKLSAEQITYAGLDVLSLLDLWPVLEAQLPMAAWAEMAERAALRIERTCTPPNRAEGETPPPDECDRALRMIKAARSRAELDRIERALPHMRIYFTNRRRVKAALTRNRNKLARGARPAKPVTVKLSGWRRPF